MSAALTIPPIEPDQDRLSAALAYAAAGWYIGPTVTSNGKHAGSVLQKGWPAKTSRDPEVIASWFAGTDHGLFLHAGRSGAVIIDVDQSDNLHDDIRRAVTELRRVPFQQTRPDIDPGRGHLIFRQPAGRILGNSVGSLGKGWGEIRGKNGIIVVAPTPHPNGGEYRWLITGVVPELPSYVASHIPDALDAADAATDEQVRQFFSTHTGGSRPELLDVHAQSFMSKVREGESRHMSMCGHLAGALKEAAAGLLDARTAADTLENLYLPAIGKPGIGKQGESRTGAKARNEWAGLLAWAVAQAQAADPDKTCARTREKIPPLGTHQHPAASADPFSKSISFAQLDGMSFRAPSYLVPKVIVLGGVVLLAGAPKIGKSHLALGIGLSVAQGGSALGGFDVTRTGPVLFISLDDTSAARAQDRARTINHGRPLPATMTLHTEHNLGRGEQARDNLARYLQGRGEGTVLVVIDTMTHLRADRGHTESVYDADVRFMAIIRTLVPDNPDTTFLGLAHIRKQAADDGLQAVSGTYGITGGADSVITLTGNRHAPGRAIEVINRDDAGGEYALRFTDHGLILTDDDPHDPALFMSHDDGLVYEALAKGGGPLTAVEVGQMLPGVTKIGDRLTRLVRHGAARRVRRGTYEAL
jgi:hypothetical protein